jgi:YVTN family beta-propeller protein
VTAEVGGTVSVIDAQKHRELKRIKIPARGAKPMGSAMSPDGKRVYITNGRGKVLTVIDTDADSIVASFEVGNRPWGVTVSPDGNKIYTANGPSNDVSVIDAATNRVLKRVPAGKSPWGVAISK